MLVLSVDLAHMNYSDIGVCCVGMDGGRPKARVLRPAEGGLVGKPTVPNLVSWLLEKASSAGAGFILIDGPQAWKDQDNGLEHSRVCERALGTPGKTGPPGSTKPANYLEFISFSVECFDHLAERGWGRVESPDEARMRSSVAESFPSSAWRFLGLPKLPAKRRQSVALLRKQADLLEQATGLTFDDAAPTHDELQAAVAGLAALGLEGHAEVGISWAGVAPYCLTGSWREGYILNPTLPDGDECRRRVDARMTKLGLPRLQ